MIESVTTPPAKAGGFYLVAEAAAPTGASRTTHKSNLFTLAYEGPVRAPGQKAMPPRRSGLSGWCFSLNAGGCESNSAGEHLWATIGTGFTCGPSPRNLQPIVSVKVLRYGTTTALACQTAPAWSADASFPSGLKPGVP